MAEEVLGSDYLWSTAELGSRKRSATDASLTDLLNAAVNGLAATQDSPNPPSVRKIELGQDYSGITQDSLESSIQAEPRLSFDSTAFVQSSLIPPPINKNGAASRFNPEAPPSKSRVSLSERTASKPAPSNPEFRLPMLSLSHLHHVEPSISTAQLHSRPTNQGYGEQRLVMPTTVSQETRVRAMYAHAGLPGAEMTL